MKKIFTTTLLLFLIISINAQNPPSVKWNKLKTEHYEIIFPAEISKDAQEIANKLEHLYYPDCRPLMTNPKPVSLVLYNQSTTSNAYARIAPRMMGWYMTPYMSPALGITDWTTTLAIHENRHIVQYSKLNNNFIKLGSIFFGDYAQAVLQFIAVPPWYFEGDAVYMETILSNSGRGRISNFSMPIRTILLSDRKRIKYDKAHFRSFKTYYPNHYYLGYHMVTHVNRNYGADTWNKIIDRTTWFAFWPFSLSRSMKKFTGYNMRRTYDNAMQELDSLWTDQIKDLEFTEVKIINQKEKKSWTNYSDPEYIDENNIYALKMSLDEATAIVKIEADGSETKIVEVGAANISYAKNKIVAKKTFPDIRYTERSYSDILVADTKTGKCTRITKKQKYFSPDISPDATKIVVVEYTSKQECSLVIINSETGEEIQKIKSPRNDYIRKPAWSEDGTKIVFTHNSARGEAMSYLDINSEKYFEIIPSGWEKIGSPQFYKNYIIYNSDYSGIGNIYAINIATKQKYQITCRKFGAYHAEISPSGKKMLFQDYTVDGYNLAEIPINQDKWKRIEDVEINKVEYFLTETNQNKIKSIVEPDSIPNTKYEVTKYNEFLNGIKIHSWAFQPSVSLNNQPEYQLQFSVFSNNKLNTLALEAGVNFNATGNTVYGYSKVSYQKYFPVFDITAMYGNRAINYNNSNGENEADSIDIWTETNISTGVTIPLNLSRNVFYTYLDFGVYANYKFLQGKDMNLAGTNFTSTGNGQFTNFHYFVNFSRTKRKAWKDIVSPFAQSISVSYKHTPLKEDYDGMKFSAVGNFYFPSFFKHHNIKIQTGFEEQIKVGSINTEVYYFSSSITLPRGYEQVILDRIYKASFDYQLPLWYPDFGINPIIYFKRVRFVGFYDFAIGEYLGSSTMYQSTGAQLLIDFHIFRLNFDLNAGVQWSYLIEDNKHTFAPIVMGMVMKL